MKIRLHIDRLVLDGIDLPRAKATHFREAMEAELSRLLAERGIHDSVRSGGAIPYVRGPELRVATPAEPASLGRDVAKAVHGGLRK